jgi:hypothetical protein
MMNDRRRRVPRIWLEGMGEVHEVSESFGGLYRDIFVIYGMLGKVAVSSALQAQQGDGSALFVQNPRQFDKHNIVSL